MVDVPQTKSEYGDDEEFLGATHLHFPYGLDGQKENEIIGNHVESPAHVENPCHVDTGARYRLIPDSRPRCTGEYFDKRCCTVKPNHEEDQDQNGDVESTAALRRKHPSIEPEDCKFRESDGNAIYYSCDVEPLRYSLAGFIVKDTGLAYI